jgi:H+/Cl- antiporter ClcA
VVIGLLSVGSIILFKTKDKNFRKGSINLAKVNLNHINKHIVSYVGLGWETVSSMQIWPLFVFLIVGSYSKLGLITSATLVVSVFVTYWVSHRADKGKRTDYIKTGGFLGAFIGILQVFVQTVTQAFAVNLGRSFAQSIFKSSFDTEYYLHADEESRSEYIYFMESAVDLSRLIFYVVMYVLSLYLTLPLILIVGLLMGAVGSLLVPLMPAAECEICGEIKNKEIRIARRLNV